MPDILDLSDIAQNIGQARTLWRDQLMPASFAGAPFHCESNSREGGQRAVTHEFPKKDLPYTETMGRRAMGFSIRGYFIVFPFDTGQPLYQRDYRVPRDNLINALDAGRPGVLQLPTQAPMWVVCTQYRMAEEDKAGGFCAIEMSFVEYGKTQNPAPNVTAVVRAAAGNMIQQTLAIMAQGPGQ